MVRLGRAVGLALRYTLPAAPLLGRRVHIMWARRGQETGLRNLYLLQWPARAVMGRANARCPRLRGCGLVRLWCTLSPASKEHWFAKFGPRRVVDYLFKGAPPSRIFFCEVGSTAEDELSDVAFSR
jgi:hypothetical protein